MSNNFKELNSQLSIVEVARLCGIEVNRSNMACCPFHNDDKPSMIISDKYNSYKCFSCDVRGDAIDFYSRFNEISMAEAANRLTEQFAPGEFIFSQGIGSGEIAEFQEKLEDKHIEFLSSRGIEKSSIGEFEIGGEGNWVVFPIRNENRAYVGSFKRKISSKEFYYPEEFPKSTTLGNLHKAKEASPSVILTESYIDCIQAFQEGISAVCSYNKDLSMHQAKLLDNYFYTIIIAYDNDEPGINGAIAAYQKLKQLNQFKDVKFAVFEGKDIGEHLYKNDQITSIGLVEWGFSKGLNYEQILKAVWMSRSFVDRRLSAFTIAEKFRVPLKDVLRDLCLNG